MPEMTRGNLMPPGKRKDSLAMLLKKYGQTTLQVSALGMGCMRLSDPDRPEEMAETVYHAFERGVNYFDTAPYYCNDRSESIVGMALREIRKTGRPCFVSTKTGESREPKIRAQLEQSLRRLGVDAVDFYHVWYLVNPTDLEMRKKNGLFDTLAKLKEEGLIRHIAVSTHLQSFDVPAMLDQGEGLFDGITISLNMLNAAANRKGAQAAASRGMGVVTMNTLGGGILTDHPDIFQTLPNDTSLTIVDAALRFNISLPEVSIALIGFRNKQDVDDAADAMDRLQLLSETEINRMMDGIRKDAEDLCTQCGYCRDCPLQIPVSRLMESYNHRILHQGDPASLLDRLTYYWKLPDFRERINSCSRCRYCERVCTCHLPILERFSRILKDADIPDAQRRDTGKDKSSLAEVLRTREHNTNRS